MDKKKKGREHVRLFEVEWEEVGACTDRTSWKMLSRLPPKKLTLGIGVGTLHWMLPVLDLPFGGKGEIKNCLWASIERLWIVGERAKRC